MCLPLLINECDYKQQLEIILSFFVLLILLQCQEWNSATTHNHKFIRNMFQVTLLIVK